MDFQRYYDGVGLIVQNKINNAFSVCPLCNDKVQWEIVFDFKGDVICVLAKCPNCGGIVKTIFDFANNQPVSTFTVAEVGEFNRNHLEQGVNYSLPSSNVTYGAQSNNASQNKSEDSGSAGWGVLGFFIPIVGFILWLVWKDDKPKCSRSAGIGCLVSICISVATVILYVAIIVGIIGIAGGIDESIQPLLNLLSIMR